MPLANARTTSTITIKMSSPRSYLVSRLTFAYHYFAAVVFLVLALGAVFDEMRARGHIRWMYAFTGVSLALFAMFYPVLTGIEVSRYYSWKVLKWFPSWPL